jgi:hypothetical protein
MRLLNLHSSGRKIDCIALHRMVARRLFRLTDGYDTLVLVYLFDIKRREADPSMGLSLALQSLINSAVLYPERTRKYVSGLHSKKIFSSSRKGGSWMPKKDNSGPTCGGCRGGWATQEQRSENQTEQQSNQPMQGQEENRAHPTKNRIWSLALRKIHAQRSRV